MRRFSTKLISILMLAAFLPGCSAIKQFFAEKDPDARVAQEERDFQIKNRAILKASLSVVNMGPQPVNSRTPYRLDISNVALGNATGLKASFSNNSAFDFCGQPYPGTGGTCGESLDGGATCNMTVCFNPSTIGNELDALKIAFTAFDESRSVDVSLTGSGANIVSLRFVDPAAAPGATSSNLGTFALNGPVISKTLQVEFFGAFPATGVNVAVKSGTFTIAGTTCLSSVSANCTVTVNQATNALGTFSGRLEITYNNGSFAAKRTYDLSATTVAMPIPSTLSLNNLTFGKVPFNGDLDIGITVVRSGSTAATINSVSFSNPEFRLSGTFPGAGGTCPALNSPFSTPSCTFIVRYHPSSVSPASGTVTLGYNSGSTSTGGSLSGDGWETATLAVSDASVSARVFAGGTATLTATLTRTGSPSVIINSGSLTGTAFSFAGGSYPGTGGTCPAFGATFSGSSCTVVLTFSPAAAINYTGTLSFNYNNGVTSLNTNSGALSGNGGNVAVVTMDAASASYGTLSRNQSLSRTFTFRNSAATNIATTLAFSGLSAPFSITTNNCTGPLAGGGSCTIIVRFLPTAAGTFNQTLTATYFDGQASQSVTRDFDGTGTLDPTLVVNNATFTPAVVVGNNSADLAVTVKYYGGGVGYAAENVNLATLPAPYSWPTGSFPGGGTCGTAITADCTIKVRFTPTVAGSASRTATLKYLKTLVGPPPETDATFSLSGTGQAPASLSIDQGVSYTFGDRPYNTVTDTTFTLRNAAGGASATSIVATGAALPLTYLAGTCGATLAAGATCSFTLRFAPTALLPTIGAGIVFTYSNGVTGASPSLAFGVTGTSHAEGALSVTGLAFGDVPVNGTSISRVLTISNTGTSNVDTISFAHPGAPFVPGTTTCTTSLAIGAACTYAYTFTPTDAGLISRTLTVTFNDNGTTRSATGNLSGGGIVPIQVAANGEHTCVLNRYRDLRCFGNNDVAQLGTGDKTHRGTSPGQVAALSPINLGTGKRAKKVVAGYWHTCAILEDDTIKCWGGNTAGQLGAKSTAATIGGTPTEMGDALVTVDLGDGVYATDLVAGYAHSCALLNTGRVKCWGLNAQGQLGYGDTLPRGASAATMGNNLPAVDLGGLATKLSVGGSDTCAILANGATKCWGDNFFGQLGLSDWAHRGDEPNEMGSNLPELSFEEASPAQWIASGGAFRVFVLASGTVAAIGRNDSSRNLGKAICQNGNGNPGLCGGQYSFELTAYGRAAGQRVADSFSRVDVGSGALRNIVAGNTHACVLTVSNQVKCWGENAKGQLGIGSTQSRGENASEMGNNLIVADLGSGFTPREIVSGSFHVCAISNGETVKCWGDNRTGQLGLGDTSPRGDAPGEMGDALTVIPVP